MFQHGIFVKLAYFLLIPPVQTIMHRVSCISKKNLTILRKKMNFEKKSLFFTFFPILMILWLCEPLRDEKLKVMGSHGRKCKLGQYINQIRAFQMICWYFDFCGLGRFCQIWPKVRWWTLSVVNNRMVGKMWRCISASVRTHLLGV